MVLGEDDPALDLAEDQRWAAAIHGKTREFSSSFREGISETLVLLAVHGGHLFRTRLGVDTEVEVMRVVRSLLPTPLTTRILEANDRDLPTYAEAAPDEFLSILERDLRSNDPAALGLLRPATAGPFGHPSRTGLLWALEGLSWNPATLPRAAFILARLAQVEINDNWVNKPTHSLESIFRAWMPQTAANHEKRVDLMRKLAEKFPDVAWNICVHQFGLHYQTGNYSHKPRWRPDGYGFGEPFPTWGPIMEFVREMVEMALTWKGHSLMMLCDLVERLHDLTDADQVRVWALVEAWAKTTASDADKATMREKIRVSTLSRRAALRARKKKTNEKSLATAGKAAYAALEPSDILNKHAWLFRDGWVAEFAEEIEDIDKFDVHKHQESIQNHRIAALCEIKAQRGLAGILELSERGNSSWVIGGLVASTVLSAQELQEFLRLAFATIIASKEEVHSYKNLIGGAVRALGDDGKREEILKGVSADLSEEETVQLLVLAPFGRSTWKLVDVLSETARAQYWSEVTPEWIHNSDAETIDGVERLLKAERPRAAFSCIQFQVHKLDAEILFRVLSAMAQGGKDKPDQYMLDHYWAEEAFKHLNKSPALTLDQKAGLEFAYLEMLAQPWGSQPHHGIPNLERYVEVHPELFIQAIVWTYKRKDGATDPADFQVSPERVTTMAERGYKLLDAIERIPGHNDLGELEADRLAKWIAAVRQSSAELGRADIADICIGKVLSHAPVGKDRVWPCEPVRDVMEEIQSEPLMEGAHTGVYNSRGAHFRGEGGGQERELAEKYHRWGKTLQVSHPFVASRLLMVLAKTYEQEAIREDTDAGIRRRLR